MTDSPRLSLTYLIRPAASADTPPLLILLHGVGSNERDLFGLVPYLDARFTIISARAPIQLAPDGFGWYQVSFTPQGPVIDPDAARAGQKQLDAFLAEAPAALGTDAARLYLMGFSQGAIMSLNTMLTGPERLAGVAAMSGRLLPDLKPTWVDPARLTGFPVIAVHGVYDSVLPIADGRAVRDTLSTLPVDLTYHEYPMRHEVSDASLSAVAGWLSAHLDAPRPATA